MNWCRCSYKSCIHYKLFTEWHINNYHIIIDNGISIIKAPTQYSFYLLTLVIHCCSMWIMHSRYALSASTTSIMYVTNAWHVLNIQYASVNSRMQGLFQTQAYRSYGHNPGDWRDESLVQLMLTTVNTCTVNLVLQLSSSHRLSMRDRNFH